MEIEAKFAIIGVLRAADIEMVDLHPYALRAMAPEWHLDTLLDTADSRISRDLYALRIRTAGERHMLTFKGPNRGVGGVHEREELEATLAAPIELDPDGWPDPIRERALALTGGEPLMPILHVAVERQRWSVRRGNRLIGELALDTGVILAAGRREPLHELELELKDSGAREDLDALSKRLMDHLSLAPESRSKQQRGLELLRHGRWTLDSYTSLDALARHYVRRKTRALRHAAHRVRHDGDADSIHDMRVATRRLRSALLNMQDMDLYRQKKLRKLHKALGRVAKTLGIVRDLDIMLALFAELEIAPEDKRKPIARLIGLLENQRQRAYDELLDVMDKPAYDDALSRLDNVVASSPKRQTNQSCLRLRDWAGGALLSRYDALARHGVAFDLNDTGGMHQARIAGKRMRYTLEMLAPALGAPFASVRSSLHTLQEDLGAFIDSVVILRTLDEANLDRLDRDSPAWRGLLKRIQDERQRRRDRAREAWDAIETGALKDALLQAIKGL